MKEARHKRGQIVMQFIFRPRKGKSPSIILPSGLAVTGGGFNRGFVVQVTFLILVLFTWGVFTL